ncbi:MAG: BatD family protein, partial [Candidatus Promineifilaceae bacterium]|nr:BatD family protein [Candidatus Promineifilaceae bacterium]
NPISVQVGGQVYATEPITVEVSQGTGQLQPAPNPGLPSMPSMPGFPNLNNLFRSMPGSQQLPGGSANPAQPIDPADAPTELAGQDFFIEAEVDKPNPYQGEQVLYTFRFYQAESLYDQPQYEAPSFTGFWSEEISDQQKDYVVEAAGRQYRVTELQAVLFPTGVGEVTIEPAQLSIPGDFFTTGQILQTQPITLNVRPLPDNAPANFQGAVGQFAVQAQADTAETEVNETVTLNVALSGQGNINAVADPIWTEGPEWRAFDSKATVNTQFENGVFSGVRLYERLLVPTQAGDLLLPAIEYSYFNPQIETYETISTEPIIVHVTGSVGASTGSAAGGPSIGSTTGPGVDATVPAAAIPNSSALRPIKAAGELNSSAAPLTENGVYWLLWLVPLMLLAGYWGWQRYQQQRLETADSRRSAGAAKRANQALKAAGKQGNGSQAAGAIMVTYLEEKMNQRVAGLSQTQVAGLLEQQGVDDELVGRVQDTLMQAEMGRYAPAGVNNAGDELLNETGQVIKELDKTL